MTLLPWLLFGTSMFVIGLLAVALHRKNKRDQRILESTQTRSLHPSRRGTQEGTDVSWDAPVIIPPPIEPVSTYAVLEVAASIVEVGADVLSSAAESICDIDLDV